MRLASWAWPSLRSGYLSLRILSGLGTEVIELVAILISARRDFKQLTFSAPSVFEAFREIGIQNEL